MKYKNFRFIIVIEVTAFLFLLLIIWLNEILDLPHYLFGFPGTPLNWVESIMESVLIIMVAIFTIKITYGHLSRISYLEKFIVICSGCKKVKINNKWINIEEYIHAETKTDFSHGICEECMNNLYGKYL